MCAARMSVAKKGLRQKGHFEAERTVIELTRLSMLCLAGFHGWIGRVYT